MTDLSRLDMPDGAWATFRTSYGWGPYIRLQGVSMDGDGWEAFSRMMVAETVTGWHVPTDAGGWQDWTPTAEAPQLPDAQMDAVQAGVGQQVLWRCQAIWAEVRKGMPDPKGTAASSTGTRRASRSRSTTRS